MFLSGLFCGFLRSGLAAFGILAAGCAAPPPATSAARLVRAISSILHQTGEFFAVAALLDTPIHIVVLRTMADEVVLASGQLV